MSVEPKVAVLIEKWLQAKKEAVAAVETERSLREELAQACFPTPVKGTQRFPLKNGFNIKLVHGLTHTLGNKDLADDQGRKVPIAEQVDDLCKNIEETGNIGGLMAERLIKWTPELVVPEYEKLDMRLEDDKRIKLLIDEMLTVKPKMPTLEFEEPKKK